MLNKELEIAKKLAILAGKEVLKIYEGEFEVMYKEDDTPLTKADLKANEIIVENLKKKFPSYGILSEEEVDSKERLLKKRCWVIDPIDGTKEFTKRNGEFTINIGLVENGEPILGVIYIPVLDELYYSKKDGGAYFEKGKIKEKIEVSSRTENLRMMISRSHATKEVEELSKNLKVTEKIVAGSSLKGCRIAHGRAEIYYRFGPVNEWDICAMNSIVLEAGGVLLNLNYEKIKYNKKDPSQIGFVILNNLKNALTL